MKVATGKTRKLEVYQFKDSGVITICPTEVKNGKFVQKSTRDLGSINAKITDQLLGKALRDALLECD